VWPLAAAALSIERVAYIWISRQPTAFTRLIALAPWLGRMEATDAIATMFCAFKLLQGSVFLGWCLVHARAGAPCMTGGPETLAAGAALVGIGQLLNARVFGLLGRSGVFYGHQFGTQPRWQTAFPFSVMRHPQYVGVCLSIWGLFLVMRFPYPDWWVLPAVETAYYAAGSALER
jgi:methylene-fatty-acyl-phospholipid synthase